jgi:hypothetical protein
VQIPAVAMPERSYMRASLAEMAEEIKSQFTAVVNDTLK